MSVKKQMEEEHLRTFIQTTHATKEIAQEFLEKNGWNFDAAINDYRTVHLDKSRALRNSQNSEPPQKKKKTTHSYSGGNSNFRTMSEMRREQEENQKKSKKQDYYAGGHSSGVQIQGPDNDDDDDDEEMTEAENAVNQVFSKAKERSIDPETFEKQKIFSGTAYRLGSTNNKSVKVSNKEVTKTITFWKTGISFDEDGELLKYSEPGTQEILNSLNNGVVPEFVQRDLPKKSKVSVRLLDRKLEEYVVPVKKFSAFTGSGRALGIDNSPSNVDNSPSNNDNITNNNSNNNLTLDVDETKPTTKIQIKLHNGKKLPVKCNLTHTIGDLRSIVQKETNKDSFSLLIPYPRKELTDDSKTIEEEKLKNAQIIQRLK
eukprot:TRINITY_DN1054_c0_g1_i1.p1 TRINITY_DN1054_c0_g1~~TRINITY_DN1054_c0_g1_i1.p1  ORF type:complete len:373 (-),score=151.58 TRINITY_DN1054_c0_g1_i1:62-1180(-)